MMSAEPLLSLRSILLILLMASYLRAQEFDEVEVNQDSTHLDKCARFEYMHDERSHFKSNDLTTTCKTQASNAHGKYTSMGTCTFKFHKIPEDIVKPNHMSIACSDGNLDEENQDAKDDPIEQPVKNWPDTCVGDFPRCYQVERDEHILLRHICKTHLVVPEGSTHVSVDCTADKTKLKEKLKKGELDDNMDMDIYVDKEYLRYEKRARREYFAFVAALAIAACFCGFLCLFLVHRYAFKPYLKALKRKRSEPELASLTSLESSRA